jgi:putative ABC transport system permease protein
MLGYYLELATRSLRRNIVLTALMIAAVGVGIGASMTMMTTLRVMSRDPIPDKSSVLFAPQIDSAGPSIGPSYTTGWLPDQLTYRDAMAFMQAKMGVRQTAMYAVGMDLEPPVGRAFDVSGRAVFADFFTMFEAPFANGAPWSAQDDEGRANVVVLGSKLADRLFPRINPVGRTLTLNGREYRIVGVLVDWNPVPKFFDTNSSGTAFANTEDFFIPFTNAIVRQLDTSGNLNCAAMPPAGWEGQLSSNCVWLQFWIELPNRAAARNFHNFLYNYAAQQRRSGRWQWPPRVALQDVNEWLIRERVVPSQVRANTLIGLGFLIVCLINAIGLMLAKFGSRQSELGVRRALGGSRTDIFLQCLTETAVIGLLGGILGLGLTSLGLAVDRALLAPGANGVQLDRLTHIDGGMLAIILAVAVAATVCAGLYPTWRASRVHPAWQLKAQ